MTLSSPSFGPFSSLLPPAPPAHPQLAPAGSCFSRASLANILFCVQQDPLGQGAWDNAGISNPYDVPMCVDWGGKEGEKTIAEWFRLESKERVIWVAVCWSFISFGSLEAQPMPRREANASSLILYLSSTAFPSHQGRRLLLVTVATARSPSQLRYCTFCSPSGDAAVRKDRPRQIPGSSFLLRCSGLSENEGRHKDERSVPWGLWVRTLDGILAGRWSRHT